MKISKLFYLPILILSAFLIFACDNGSNSIDEPTAEELAVLDEMNYARTKPKEYVANRLQPLRTSYTGTNLTALNELIDEMNSMSALPAYEWGDGLYKAAAGWVAEQGPTGATGHGDPWSRIKVHCSYGAAAENISYGYNQAVDIVIQLLVDDGVEGRGHRKNILSASYTHAGAAIGTHKTYTYMCCIDFAGGYSEK